MEVIIFWLLFRNGEIGAEMEKRDKVGDDGEFVC
jgi:hypothetical protein